MRNSGQHIFLLILITFLWITTVQAQDANLNSQAVELETNKGTLKGTLLTPSVKKQGPVVLIIAGSGPTDRDGNNVMMKNNSLKFLAEALYSEGIATLRYDKRGVGESKPAVMKEEDFRFEDMVQDAAGWITQLKKDKRFNQIIVLGHSEGSLIGMLAAQQASADGFISVAGPGQSADKIIRLQLQLQPKMVSEAALPILEQLTKGKPVAEVNPMLASLFRPSVQPYLMSWFKYDPQVEIKKLKVPVLILQGTHDLQVSTQDAKRLSAAAPAAKLVEVPQMNHVLKINSGDLNANKAAYSDPTLPVAPLLLTEVAAFVKSVH